MTVTLGSHTIDQGNSLKLYLNASNLNAPFSIDATGNNGLCVIHTNKEGIQLSAVGTFTIPFSLNQENPRIVLSWNLNYGNLGRHCGIENCLLPAGYYELTEGSQCLKEPGNDNFSFKIIDPYFQIKGVGMSLANNNTDVFIGLNSSLPNLIQNNSTDIKISNIITNDSNDQLTYQNFSQTVSVPGSLTFLYKSNSKYQQFIAIVSVQTTVGRVAEVAYYGIYQ
ncbi:MAG: hypothetical protein M1327_03365 [Candidatus Thermoplasmatota archaeon]|nr:hypothetical protein [Candidatus Thermoplasmatota archaeon]